MARFTEVDLDELMTRLVALAEAQAPLDEASDDEGEGGNFDCVGCEGCRRCRFCAACRDCEDCTYCEECVECVSCTHAVRSVECDASSHLRDCRGCEDSRYLLLCVECVSCTYCLGCVGLEGQEFHVLNEPVSRSEYFKLVKALGIELEVRTHLGWRPAVIGLEAEEYEPAWSGAPKDGHADDDADAVSGFTEALTDGTSRSPPGIVAPVGPERASPVESSSMFGGSEASHDHARSFTGFEDPPAPRPSSLSEAPARPGGSGWISAIADAAGDATGDVDHDDPIIDSSPPEVTHTRLVEPTDFHAPAGPSKSNAPERLSLDALDEEADEDPPSEAAVSLSSKRLGEAVSRSVRGRGAPRRSSQDRGGLDPLGALVGSEGAKTILSKLRSGADEAPVRAGGEGARREERASSRSLFDSRARASTPQKDTSIDDVDAPPRSLRRGRRPVRRGPSGSDGDGFDED